LADMGYKNVRDYEGGKKDWTDAGLPTEGKY
jgi:rhodanese-related sulfurtransferase